MTNLNRALMIKPILNTGVSRCICFASVIAAISSGTAFAGNSSESGQKQLPLNIQSRFYGIVKSIPEGRIGLWSINRRKILVTKDTIIGEGYGKALVGAYVEVEGNNTGRIFSADRLQVKRASKH